MRDVELRRYVEKAMMDCIKWPKLNHYSISNTVAGHTLCYIVKNFL